MNVHAPINTPWSPEEKERAIALDLKGLTASQIADAVSVEFGTRRTRNAVIGLINRSGARERREARAPSRSLAALARGKAKARAHIAKLPLVQPILFSPSKAAEAKDDPATSARSPDNVEISKIGVPLNMLEPVHCRNVIQENPYLFCGRPTAFGTSWCAECAPRIFTAEGYARLKSGKKPSANTRSI